MSNFFKTKYRIVPDDFAGWEAQGKPWWSPFWIELGRGSSFGINSHVTIEHARAFINQRRATPIYIDEV